jgi:hypothetical protein
VPVGSGKQNIAKCIVVSATSKETEDNKKEKMR